MSVKIIGSTSTTDVEVDTTAKAARLTTYRTDAGVDRVVPVGSYAFTFADQATPVNAVFLTLFNPNSSSRLVKVRRISICNYGVAAIATKNSMHVTRITSSTGGVLQTSIFKFDSLAPNPAADIRITSPVIVAGAEFVSVSSYFVGTTITYSPSFYEWTAENDPDREVILNRGEGLAFRTTATSDADQTYNLGIGWEEV